MTAALLSLATLFAGFAAGWNACAALYRGKCEDAWSDGRSYGRDEQWADDIIAAAKKEQARHDRAGRFKAFTK